MDKITVDYIEQCCNEYSELMANFLKQFNITRVTSSKNPLYLAERNQSANFANAVQRKYPKATAWFEFPFGKNKHLDALIFIPKGKDLLRDQVLLVESKNLRTLSKKIPEIIEDILRIDSSLQKKQGDLKPKLEALFGNCTNLDFFGVILCDVQKTKSDHHLQLANRWDRDGIECLLKKEGYIIEPQMQAIVDMWISRSNPRKFSQVIINEKGGNEEIPYEQLIRYWPVDFSRILD